MKKCPSCGFEQSPDNSKFCIHCGAPLSGGQPATGDAQQSQSARPAAAPMQRANAFPGVAPSAPGVSRPSPYAALPHIPASAKGGKSLRKKSRWPALLGGAALIVFCICILFLLIQMGIGLDQLGDGTSSPTSAPYTYRLGGDAYLSEGQEPSLYYINGSIYIDSTARFSKATITVFIYQGNYRVASVTRAVDVYNNTIEYSLPVRLDSFYARTSDRILVEINDIY